MADNLNLSPDMINNLVNMLKNDNSTNLSTSNNSSNSKKETIEDNNTNNHENNSTIDFTNLLKNFANNHSNSNTSNNTSENNSSNFFNNLDFETIMKLKSIIDSLNNNNSQDSKLLYSLKPYLRKSRQEKIEQYINILKISQISKIFKKGDDK